MNNISREPVKRKSVFLALFLPMIMGGVSGLLLAMGTDMESLWMMASSAVIFIAALVICVVVISGVIKGINAICKNEEKPLIPYIGACVLSVITLGIYDVYYVYKSQKKVCAAAERFDADVRTRPSTVMTWEIIGLIIILGRVIAYVLLIRSYNRLAAAYNEQGNVQWDDEPVPLPLSEPSQPQQPEPLQIQTAALETPARGVMRCAAGVTDGPVIRFDKNRNKATLGRKPEMADVVIVNQRVSRVHCDIIFDEQTGIFYVTDRNSTNGILIKGSEGTKKPEAGVPAALAEGDQLILPDDIIFEFEVFK